MKYNGQLPPIKVKFLYDKMVVYFNRINKAYNCGYANCLVISSKEGIQINKI